MDLLGDVTQEQRFDLQSTLQSITQAMQQLVVLTQQQQQRQAATEAQAHQAMSTYAATTQQALQAVAQSLTTQSQSQAFRAASIESISGEQPGKLFLWFKRIEGLAASCNVDLNSPAVLARISGYFTGELGLWFATRTPELLNVPYNQFKQSILEHFGLYTSPEVAVMTLLNLTMNKAVDYAKYLTEFNNTLSLLTQDKGPAHTALEKIFVMSLFRHGLPRPLGPIAAEYSGDDLEALQTHIRNRLVRDSSLAAAVKFASTLESPTAMDLGLAVQPAAAEAPHISAVRTLGKFDAVPQSRKGVPTRRHSRSGDGSERAGNGRARTGVGRQRTGFDRHRTGLGRQKLFPKRSLSNYSMKIRDPPPGSYQRRPRSINLRPVRGGGGAGACFNCGAPDHWAAECPLPRAMDIGVVQDAESTQPAPATSNRGSEN